MQVNNHVIIALYVVSLIEIIDASVQTKWLKFIRLFLLGWLTTALGG